jgi:hypothetical protein
MLTETNPARETYQTVFAAILLVFILATCSGGQSLSDRMVTLLHQHTGVTSDSLRVISINEIKQTLVQFDEEWKLYHCIYIDRLPYSSLNREHIIVAEDGHEILSDLAFIEKVDSSRLEFIQSRDFEKFADSTNLWQNDPLRTIGFLLQYCVYQRPNEGYSDSDTSLDGFWDQYSVRIVSSTSDLTPFIRWKSNELPDSARDRIGESFKKAVASAFSKFSIVPPSVSSDHLGWAASLLTWAPFSHWSIVNWKISYKGNNFTLMGELMSTKLQVIPHDL